MSLYTLEKVRGVVSEMAGALWRRVAPVPLGGRATEGPHRSGTASPSSLGAAQEITREEVERALARSREALLHRQHPEGYWAGELQADSTLTSEYLLLRRFLGKTDPKREAAAAQYLRRCQLPEGGWGLYPGGPSDLSATVKAYFALKVAGASPGEDCLRRAREFILSRGGAARVNVFTRILLALFGQYEWRYIPAMPVEIVLLPRLSPFTIYRISYWSRTVLVPLLLIFAHRPLCLLPAEQGIGELFTFPVRGAPFPWEKPWWRIRNLFLALDRLLHLYEAHPLPFLRTRALSRARNWMLPHMQGSGGLGAIYPAMANSIIALTCLGYPTDHPTIEKALGEIEVLEVWDERGLHLQPCHSPVWDTCLASLALLASGLPPDHPALTQAAAWLLTTQITRAGDWAVTMPGVAPGGWYFQFENEFYPDVDDTAVALMVLHAVRLSGGAKGKALSPGLTWMLAMQGRDGGWGAFDRDNNKVVFNQIPFADHGALLDPSSNDVTARVLEALGRMGYPRDHPVVERGLAFLRTHQEPEGAWYGRWGVNYIYGTWSVLAALRVLGEPMEQEMVQRAVSWLLSRQNPEGGWGESCYSYTDPRTAGEGVSTASQTAWALLALLHAGVVHHPAVARGIAFLLTRQTSEGVWEEEEFTGTGFPRVFFLRYHMYRHYFPLWALSLYRTLRWDLPREVEHRTSSLP